MRHQKELHIIEPTLADQSGHCHGYVQSLIQASKALSYDLSIWLDQRGHALFQGEGCHSQPYFRRRWRKLQLYFCLRSLIQGNKTIFIPTAAQIELIYLHRLLKRHPYRGKVFLHFHQFTVTNKKIAVLQKIASQHPEFIILAPTTALLNIFQKAG